MDDRPPTIYNPAEAPAEDRTPYWVRYPEVIVRFGIFIVLVLAFLFGGLNFLIHTPLNTGKGQVAPYEPLQVMLKNPVSFHFKDSTIQKLASYSFKARVLHTTPSWLDPVSNLSPMDMGIGWGVMSDQSMVDQFEFSQTNRFLLWQPKNQSIMALIGKLQTKMANVHIIPANDQVRNTLQWVRPGNVVEVKGYLVNVTRSNGSWHSSLTRYDTGDGACEVMYVESFQILK